MSAVLPPISVEYDLPQASGVCSTKYAWAKVPVEPTPDERLALKA